VFRLSLSHDKLAVQNAEVTQNESMWFVVDLRVNGNGKEWHELSE